jgi:hypothetical protein
LVDPSGAEALIQRNADRNSDAGTQASAAARANETPARVEYHAAVVDVNAASGSDLSALSVLCNSEQVPGAGRL